MEKMKKKIYSIYRIEALVTMIDDRQDYDYSYEVLSISEERAIEIAYKILNEVPYFKVKKIGRPTSELWGGTLGLLVDEEYFKIITHRRKK